MKTVILVGLCFLAIIISNGQLFAQQDVQQQSTKSAADQPRQIMVYENDLTPEQLAAIKARQEQQQVEEKVKKYGWYAGLGKEIGEGVNEGLKAITDRAAEFAKTDVGKFTMFMIAWKILGKDAIQFVVGVPVMFVFLLVWFFSYYRNCIVRKVVVEKTKEGKVTYKVINEPESADELRAENIIHWVMLIVLVIIGCIIIFS